MEYRRRTKTSPSSSKHLLLRGRPLTPLTSYIVSGLGLAFLFTLCTASFHKTTRVNAIELRIAKDSSEDYYPSSLNKVLNILNQEIEVNITREQLLSYTPLSEIKSPQLNPSCSLAHLDPIPHLIDQAFKPVFSLSCDSSKEVTLELDAVATEQFLSLLPDHFSFMGRVEVLIDSSSSQIVGLNPMADLDQTQVLLHALNQSEVLGKVSRSNSSLIVERLAANLLIVKP